MLRDYLNKYTESSQSKKFKKNLIVWKKMQLNLVQPKLTPILHFVIQRLKYISRQSVIFKQTHSKIMEIMISLIVIISISQAWPKQGSWWKKVGIIDD